MSRKDISKLKKIYKELNDGLSENIRYGNLFYVHHDTNKLKYFFEKLIELKKEDIDISYFEELEYIIPYYNKNLFKDILESDLLGFFSYLNIIKYTNDEEILILLLDYLNKIDDLFDDSYYTPYIVFSRNVIDTWKAKIIKRYPEFMEHSLEHCLQYGNLEDLKIILDSFVISNLFQILEFLSKSEIDETKLVVKELKRRKIKINKNIYKKLRKKVKKRNYSTENLTLIKKFLYKTETFGFKLIFECSICDKIESLLSHNEIIKNENLCPYNDLCNVYLPKLDNYPNKCSLCQTYICYSCYGYDDSGNILCKDCGIELKCPNKCNNRTFEFVSNTQLENIKNNLKDYSIFVEDGIYYDEKLCLKCKLY